MPARRPTCWTRTSAWLAEQDTRYRHLDRLVEPKDQLLKCRLQRWETRSGAKFTLRLYALTSTDFETDEDRGADDLRQFGYGGGKRGDCRQFVMAPTACKSSLRPSSGDQPTAPRRTRCPASSRRCKCPTCTCPLPTGAS